ncbi:hypothetical protein FOMA001_g20088 [Fusarium oxysporum f. sp. matthiolae]|nr:hypothetical protein FOMA001_g20088 [Fusarium oxysporum f. sp. matthiolae]
MNNDTRWNSTYLMISRALVKQGDIRAFLVYLEVERWLPEADMLKGDDWRLLAEIKYILKPFYLQTMRTQGWGSERGNGRLWEVMTGTEYLLEHLEDRKLFYHAVPDDAAGENTNSQVELARGRSDRNRQIPARFRDCEMDIYPRKSMQSSLPSRGSGQCDEGPGKSSGSSGIDDMGKDHRRYLRLLVITAWQKLNEYYTKLGESPLFAASIILHLSLGMSYLEVNWASEEQLVWVRDAKIGLSDYLDRWYRCSRPVDKQQKAIVETATSLSVPRKTSKPSVFRQWVKSRTAKTTATGSELEQYLRLEPQETKDPIK